MSTVPIKTDSGPQVVLELLLRLKVRDAMSGNVITVGPGDSMRHVQHLMRDHSITGVPVLDKGCLVGIVSINDIIIALDAGKIEEPASKVMNATVITLDENMPLSFAVTYCDRYKYGRFPVMDSNGRLVGIITASDIVRSLLLALNEEVAKLEQRLSETAETAGVAGADGTANIGDKAAGASAAAGDGAALRPRLLVELHFPITPLDFSRAGQASGKFKKALAEIEKDPAFVRRVAVASYELELNEVIHSKGGVLSMIVTPDTVEIIAQDEGPGIEDLDAAMREGFSTATEWVRSLGFGAGMGLPNIKRVSDDFKLESEVGKGTKVWALLRRGGSK